MFDVYASSGSEGAQEDDPDYDPGTHLNDSDDENIDDDGLVINRVVDGEEAEESDMGDVFNSLVGGLLRRVGIRRLLGRRFLNEPRLRGNFPPLKSTPVPFLGHELSNELRGRAHVLASNTSCNDELKYPSLPMHLSMSALNQPLEKFEFSPAPGTHKHSGSRQSRLATRGGNARRERTGAQATFDGHNATTGPSEQGASDLRASLLDLSNDESLPMLHRRMMRLQALPRLAHSAEKATSTAATHVCSATSSGSLDFMTDANSETDTINPGTATCGDASPTGETPAVPTRSKSHLAGSKSQYRSTHTACTSINDASQQQERSDADDTHSDSSAPDIVPWYPTISHLLHSRGSGWSSAVKCHVSSVMYPPVHRLREVEARPSRAYIGRFSPRGDVFVAGYQDAHLRVLDTSSEDIVLRKDIEARRIRWTITDTAISQDSAFLLYSSLSRFGHLVRIEAGVGPIHSVTNITEVHEELELMAESDCMCSVWALSWSPVNSEVVAGTSYQGLVVYDLARSCRNITSYCHSDDINSVAHGDPTGNVLITGSDDTRVFVHDRRTLRNGEIVPEGQLLGHTEGVTHVSARGDGRYIISNAKDSTIRLWDLRQMSSGSRRVPSEQQRSLSGFDYRWADYPHATRFTKRPHDDSIMTFRGHKVLQTLIRAYWAPEASTAGRCIFSGSADGSIYVFDTLTGHVQQELRHHADVVRECSWHPTRNQLISASWDGSVVEWAPRASNDCFKRNIMLHEDDIP